jgi:hypothetical protein
MIRPATRHVRSRRATGECVAAAGRPPRHGTARATRTRIANAAIPARRNGPGSGFVKRCAHGESATALRRPHMTGRAPTQRRRGGEALTRLQAGEWPAPSTVTICTGAGRRPSPTPSAARERPGHNAVVTTDLAVRLVICEGERRPSPRTPRPFVSVAATRPSAPGDCWAREATVTCVCKPPRIGPPANTSTTLATAAKQAYRLIPPEVATVDDGAVPEANRRCAATRASRDALSSPHGCHERGAVPACGPEAAVSCQAAGAAMMTASPKEQPGHWRRARCSFWAKGAVRCPRS